MLSPIGVAEHAARAGWRGTDLPVAVAVALAESGGNEKAHAVDGEDSRGLWQINVRAHPQLASQNLYDPAVNARAAFGLWKSQGWGPWSAHNNNKYLLFMPPAVAAISAASVKMILQDPAGAIGGAVGGVAGKLPGADMLDAAKSGLTVLHKAGAWLSDRNNWTRIAYVMLGTGMLWGGVLMVIGKPVLNTTGTAVGAVLGTRTAGKAVKTVKAAKAAGTAAGGSS